MTDPSSGLTEAVRQALAAGDVRKAAAELTLAGVAKVQQTSGDLLAFVTSLLGAARSAAPPSPTGPLRQFVDGVGDGLGAAALALKLSVEEAARHGERFAREDLARMHRDLGTVLRDFEAAVAKTLHGAWSTADDLLAHAKATLQRMQPGLQAALTALQDQPGELLRETTASGVRSARRAAGALFTALGERLRRAGERLHPPS